MSRATWDETWEKVSILMRGRSLCEKARVGAVIADSTNRVVSTGYNGPPAGFAHSDLGCEQWCPRGADKHDEVSLERCVSVHAEANAIISGDRSTWAGGTIYVTKHPCMECAKLIANSGLARVYVATGGPELEERHVEVYRFLMEECGVEVELHHRPELAPLVPLHLSADWRG